jgi:hypothetical protein
LPKVQQHKPPPCRPLPSKPPQQWADVVVAVIAVAGSETRAEKCQERKNETERKQ